MFFFRPYLTAFCLLLFLVEGAGALFWWRSASIWKAEAQRQATQNQTLQASLQEAHSAMQQQNKAVQELRDLGLKIQGRVNSAAVSSFQARSAAEAMAWKLIHAPAPADPATAILRSNALLAAMAADWRDGK